MSKWDVVQEIHKYARKNFQRRKVTVFAIAEFIQCDLIEMQPYKRENLGYRYILIVIDVFSKMAYAEGLLDKTAAETTKAMERIIQKLCDIQIEEFINCSRTTGRNFLIKK